MHDVSNRGNCCAVLSRFSHVQLFEPTGLLCPWEFPGKITGMGCRALLQGIFLTQGLDLHLLGLLHWQADSSPVHRLRSPVFWNQVLYQTLCICVLHIHSFWSFACLFLFKWLFLKCSNFKFFKNSFNFDEVQFIMLYGIEIFA